MVVQQQIAVNLQRRVSVQSLAGAIVNLISNSIELVLAVARQICAFGQLGPACRIAFQLVVQQPHRRVRAAARNCLASAETG